MRMRMNHAFALGLLAFAGLNPGVTGNAQADKTGQVRVHVSPEEAYIWVDDKPISHRSSTLKLIPGEHKITVYNYGFQPETQKVTVVAGERKEMEARLKPVGKRVTGPWGRIQIEGVPGDALVFLNGTTPEFFVGHADEMNDEFFSDQALIVPVGKQQVHILENKTGREIWTGTVEVRQNERLIIYPKAHPDQQLVYKSWFGAEQFSSLKRFEAGTASARIAVAPVKAKMAVDHTAINCDEPVKISWDSTDAASTVVKANDKAVAYGPAGAIEDRPHQPTTTYEFHAAGPGGVIDSDATVRIDNAVRASLTPTKSELRYVKVGDKVQEQGSMELRWFTTNADSVKIDPIGNVSAANGGQTIRATPQKTTPGPVDETVVYKITATNVCGGTETSEAVVHLTGSIEPAQVAAAQPARVVVDAEPERAAAQPVQVAKAAPPQPSAEELPNTASALPLLALGSLGLLGTAGLLWTMRRR